MTAPILSLQSVSKTFFLAGREVRAVDDVSIDVAEGECLAIVGESGSGKSTLANMILGVYPPTAGTIAYRGTPLPARCELKHRRLIQFVQQNPLSALNPQRSVGASLRLALDVHGVGKKSDRRAEVGRLLEEVGLPASFMTRAPAALSGGQRQRVAIARALALRPDLVVLDEAVSALDVLVRAQILRLLDDLQRQLRLTYLFISHDLSVVRMISDEVHVMHRGRIVESGTPDELFDHPRDAYTQELLAAIPGRAATA